MSVAESVGNRIKRTKRGVPFSITRFYELGNKTAVRKALSRLVGKGELVRLANGYYARPKPILGLTSISVAPSAEKVARIWASDHGYMLVSQGFESAYRLGFQTQSPMKRVFWSDGPSREFKVGNDICEIQHKSNSKLRLGDTPEGSLFRGLLVTSPGAVSQVDLNNAMNRLSFDNDKAKIALRKIITIPELKHWRETLTEFRSSLH